VFASLDENELITHQLQMQMLAPSISPTMWLLLISGLLSLAAWGRCQYKHGRFLTFAPCWHHWAELSKIWQPPTEWNLVCFIEVGRRKLGWSGK